MAILLSIWTLQTLLAGTAVVALRTASRSRLIESLKRIDRPGRIELFDAHDHEFALMAAVGRQLGIVLFVATCFYGISESGGELYRLLILAAGCFVWISLFGTAIPAAWARYGGERYLASMLPWLEAARRAGRPLLVIMRVTDEIVRRLSGARRESPNDPDQVEREILDALSHGEVSGDVDEREKAIIRSAMTLDEMSAGEIMTPRTNMRGVEVGAGYEEVRRAVIEAGHSRIPVYEETLDHIVGILYAKDLIPVTDPGAFQLKDLMRSATFVPETKDVASCLREFQSSRVHIAIVLDEYGGTAGLVTIEDILEELVGEIVDEHDAPPDQPIRRLDARTAEVDARVRVEEINEALSLNIPEDESYDTIGGFVLSRLGRIPLTGESFEEENIRVEVLAARQRAVDRLRLQWHERSEAS